MRKKISDLGVTLGCDNEIFFNKESKTSTWEITYDSTNDVVRLHYFRPDESNCDIIAMSKKEYTELKSFLNGLRLQKNYKMSTKTIFIK